MIPKIIHYCWFGLGPLSETALKCIESWHRFMPDWEYVLWNEENFDVNSYPYSQEAYETKKYAFVSDVARLRALKEQGGVYFDVDFEVYKPFDDLLHNDAFAGFEGSKHHPVMMGVLGSVPQGFWVSRQLERYENRLFNVGWKAGFDDQCEICYGRDDGTGIYTQWTGAGVHGYAYLSGGLLLPKAYHRGVSQDGQYIL